MRISDERYHRDRLRYDLALRMIGHEARTCTIRSWTGLSDDRIRRLYKTYVEFESRLPVRRHRGKSPQQPSYFLRTQAIQIEATLLATVFGSTGLLSGACGNAAAMHRLEAGTRFCDAYESYLLLARQPALSFEHGCLLLHALLVGGEICLWTCPRCSGPFLRDALAVDHKTCPLCRLKRAGAVPSADRHMSLPGLLNLPSTPPEVGQHVSDC